MYAYLKCLTLGKPTVLFLKASVHKLWLMGQIRAAAYFFFLWSVS